MSHCLACRCLSPFHVTASVITHLYTNLTTLKLSCVWDAVLGACGPWSTKFVGQMPWYTHATIWLYTYILVTFSWKGQYSKLQLFVYARTNHGGMSSLSYHLTVKLYFLLCKPADDIDTVAEKSFTISQVWLLEPVLFIRSFRARCLQTQICMDPESAYSLISSCYYDDQHWVQDSNEQKPWAVSSGSNQSTKLTMPLKSQSIWPSQWCILDSTMQEPILILYISDQVQSHWKLLFMFLFSSCPGWVWQFVLITLYHTPFISAIIMGVQCKLAENDPFGLPEVAFMYSTYCLLPFTDTTLIWIWGSAKQPWLPAISYSAQFQCNYLTWTLLTVQVTCEEQINSTSKHFCKEQIEFGT